MKIAVLISGQGTLLKAMIDQNIPIEFVLVDKVCDGIAYANEAGIPVILIDRRDPMYGFQVGKDWNRRGFSQDVSGLLHSEGIELVVMAGFMTVFDQVMFDRYAGRVLNSHPALLPNFKGAKAVQDALDAGVAETGSTIHVATKELDDSTTVLAQVRVPVMVGDDEESLWDRIKIEERKLYPQVLKQILSGEIHLP